MPLYTVAAVAEALAIEYKQIDNILSRHEMPGVARRRHRGIPRRLAPGEVITLRVALVLHRTLNVPIATALRVAGEVGRSGRGVIELGPGLSLTADLDALKASTTSRLDAAVESVVRKRRGRPSRRPRNEPAE